MQAFVAAEDNRFFEHHGIDPLGILRAAFANLKAGRVVQGGSTITQQVAKLMLVGNERNVFRKIREAILAAQDRGAPHEGADPRHLPQPRLSRPRRLRRAGRRRGLLRQGRQGSDHRRGGDARRPAQGADGGLAVQRPSSAPRIASATCSARCSRTSSSPTPQYRDALQEPIAIISQGHAAQPHRGALLRRARAQDACRPSTAGAICTTAACASTPRSTCGSSAPPRRAVRHGLEDVDRRFGFRGPVGHLDDAKRAAVPRGDADAVHRAASRIRR